MSMSSQLVPGFPQGQLIALPSWVRVSVLRASSLAEIFAPCLLHKSCEKAFLHPAFILRVPANTF